MNRKEAGAVVTPRTLQSIRGDVVPIPHPDRVTHLQFRRYSGCPVCNLHVRTFMRRHDELAALGIQAVVVFHSSRARMLKRFPATPFPLVADPERRLYGEFGVGTSVRAVLSIDILANATRGLVRHGVKPPELGESIWGLPADFLIGTDGRVLAARYGTHADDHWEFDEVVALASSPAGETTG
jgi:peroxiredoxin